MADTEKKVEAATKKSVKKAAPKKKAAAKTAAPKKAAAKQAPAKKAAAKPAVQSLRVTLKRSKNGRLAAHKACVAGLGLRKMHQTVEVIDTPENRGMINQVQYLLNVEEV